MNPDDLLAELDPEQREVALALRGPVRVLAGAGTGKTRAITHRIAYGVASGVYTPTEVLAVTFTTRAAGEMRSRLRALGAPGVQARTFHAAALRQVRYFWPKVYGGDAPILTESKLPLVGRAPKGVAVSTNRGVLRDLASEIEWAKVSNVRPEDYLSKASKLQRTVSDLEPSAVAAVYDAYEMHKSAEGRMDMEDVLLLAAAILSEDERTAAMVRGQYKHLVVDEYQDVNPIQQTLLGLWLGGSEQLCVVGDPAQTIYSFAGARADYLLDFTKTWSIDDNRNNINCCSFNEYNKQLIFRDHFDIYIDINVFKHFDIVDYNTDDDFNNDDISTDFVPWWFLQHSRERQVRSSWNVQQQHLCAKQNVMRHNSRASCAMFAKCMQRHIWQLRARKHLP